MRNVGLVDVYVSVGGGSRLTGALAGDAYGRIASSYVVSGTVVGDLLTGSLVGSVAGSGIIIASYANVSVDSPGAFLGGLAGGVADMSIVSASYTLATMRRSGFQIGGVAGGRSLSAQIRSSYFDRERSGQSSCCGQVGPLSPDNTPKTSFDLRNPTTTADTIYAGWDRLDLDGDGDFNDAPWDFGNSSEYPLLRGMSARYPTGNTTNIVVQRRLQPPVLATLSQRGGVLATEGSTATYAVELDVPSVGAVTMNWSVELTGASTGHAEAADFDGSTRGQVVLAGTDSAVFQVGIVEDEMPELRETFRVRLRNLQGPDNVRLSAASSSVISVIEAHGFDYDTDDNNLIDVRNRAQLEAITHDLTGAGNAAPAAYGTAFPGAMQGMGCPGTCTGYELLNDVDLSGENWDPIGGGPRDWLDNSPDDNMPDENRYNGVFEGNGHVIRNMRIDGGSGIWEYVGLFRGLGADSVVRNVGLVDVYVRVDEGRFAGALAGDAYGRIASSYVVSGTVVGDLLTGSLVGSVAGSGIIIASYANVSVDSSGAFLGGLVGSAADMSIVSASYTLSTMQRSGSQIGGLAGGRSASRFFGTAEIQSSYFDRWRSGQSSCCGGVGPLSPDNTPQTSLDLRTPTTTADTIYAGWDQLDLDGDGERNDAPWDFGSESEYPVLRGVSARYPVAGNTTNVGVQRRLQPPILVALSQRGGDVVAEGSTVTYAVELDARSADPISMTWSVELTGAGAGHAAVADFPDTSTSRANPPVVTTGTITIVNTASAVFQVGIVEDGMPELRETFRVRLSNLQGPDNVRLRAASSAVISVIEANGFDYDTDDNNLIDVRNRAQLEAITHDLTGAGNAAAADYDTAFPGAMQGMGCPTTCTGYELLNDVDLSGENWDPIGGGPRTFNNAPFPDENRYNGVFEGNGHVIRNMRIDGGNRAWEYVGLFRFLGADSIVRNVGLVDVYVRVDVESFRTGALAGDAHGRIASSYVVGGTVVGGFQTGSLVGSVGGSGIIIASYANVLVDSMSRLLGALAGTVVGRSIVSASYTLSTMRRSGFRIGGVTGGRSPSAGIQSSYFDRWRSGQSSCCGREGPLSPDNTPKTSFDLRNPTTTADTIYAGWDQLDLDGDGERNDAPWDFGSDLDYPVLRGVGARYPVAGNTTNADVQRRLQPPILVALSQRGGDLVAEGSTVTYAVELDFPISAAITMTWSVELTDAGAGAGHAAVADFPDTSTSRANPPVVTTGTITIVNTDSAVFQVEIVEDEVPELRETFRVRLSNLQGPDNVSLRVASSAVVSVIARNGNDYDPDDNDLIDVMTTSQLAAIRYDLDGDGVPDRAAYATTYSAAFPFFDEFETCPGGCKGYELSNDIDLSGEDWTPIGGGGTSDRYNAVFEGNGHIVRNMKFTRTVGSPRYDGVGLFGALGAGGKIRSAGIENVSVHAPESVGVGALVGIAYGRIAASYAVGGVVTGSWAVGGLVGEMRGGSVIAGYSDAAVHGRGERAGGLIGSAQGVSIVSASYTIGVPTGGGGHRGGLMGFRLSTVEIQSSYFDRERTGQTRCCGTNPPSPDNTPKTSAELRIPTEATGIYAGWDRLDVAGDGDFNDAPWDFGSSLDYPLLRGMSARYPTGNTASAAVQRRLQPPILATLSQRGGFLAMEGSTATYAVELDVPSVGAVTMNWSVELTGASTGHAAAADFDGVTSGEVVLINTDSAVFTVEIARDEVLERLERFRVRLSDLRGPDNFRLSVAASAVVSIIAPQGRDYDENDDGLIEVATTSQLAAITHDLRGGGLAGVDYEDVVAYEAAFPFFDVGETCTRGCTGYELVNDLDLAGEDWNPIGGGGRDNRGDGQRLPEEHLYKGVFEGNGHVISNMIVGGSRDIIWHFAALFQGLGAGGVIRNVGLADVDVFVHPNSIQTGGLAGVNYGGKVVASYVRGPMGEIGGRDVGVIGGWGVGGLVAVNEGTIIASYTDVYVGLGAMNAGGLVGYNAPGAKIIASYSLREVELQSVRIGGISMPDRNIGGLVGVNNAASTAIESSYFDRQRSSLSSGGLRVSSSAAQTSQALRSPIAAEGIYAAWSGLNVDDTSSTVMGVSTLDDDNPWDFGTNLDYPALRGVSARYPNGNTTGIRVQRPVADVLVTLSQGAGNKLEGAEAEYAVTLSAYGPAVTMTWSVEFTGVGMGHADADDFSAATRGQVVLVGTDSAVFTITIKDDNVLEESEETFRVRLSEPRGLERLRLDAASSAVVSVIARDEVDYDADDNNLIDVMTTSQLSAIRYDLGGMGLRGVADGDMVAYDEAFPSFDESGCPGGCKGYELVNDLDLSGDDWIPIGRGSSRYNAVFEGNGHVVRNMKFTRAVGSDRYDDVGLFGILGAGGKIRSVGLENVSVNAPESVGVGALAGTAYGRIAASYAVGGVVTGSWAVGGLVGEIFGGTVIASYSDVAVHGRGQRAGGLIGSVSGGVGVGQSVVSASYTIGVPTGGGGHRGGLTGFNDSSFLELQSSYFDRRRAGLSACCGTSMPSSNSAPARTSAELRGPTSAMGIYAGWDKLDVDADGDFNDAPWDFGNSSEYPLLRGMSARYPTGNSTSAGVQRRLQPPVLATLSQRGDVLATEGSTATYAVELDVPSVGAVTMNWSVELTGAGTGHAAAADFSGATSGEVVLVNTDSAVFRITIEEDDGLERLERFRVRLSDLQGADNFRLSVAASAVVSFIAPQGRDYDENDDGLIEVATTSQLAAITHDLRGRGLAGVDYGDVVAYEAAYPFFDVGETCTRGCTGYELLNDLDLSGLTWQPIGSGLRDARGPGQRLPEEYLYKGVFEGNGHVISNMRVVSGGRPWQFVALFQGLGVGGVIRNVGLADVRVALHPSSIQTAGLVGVNYGGKVAACWVTGRGHPDGDMIGGWGVGGLVAFNGGTIIASYTDVTVGTGAAGAGGLVGYNAPGAKIIASYSLRNVKLENVRVRGVRDRDMGGLVGHNDGAIESSYFDRQRSGLSSGGVDVSSSAVQTSRALRSPIAAEGIYAAWSGLNVDDTSSTVMGVSTLDDDNPWDFGTNVDYPALRGVSARYPKGNTTGVRAQRPVANVLVTLSQGAGNKLEGAEAEYAVTLGAYGPAVTMTWSVEFTGVGMGHADADDFSAATRGQVVLAGTDSAVFRIAIEDGDGSEGRETFRVRLSEPRGLDGLRLSAASSAVVSVIASNGNDYDPDDNNLIDVMTTTQLKAIRYDLGGMGLRGVADGDDVVAYEEAFPFFDESGCPGGCKGYELVNDLDLSGDDWIPIGGGSPLAYYTAVFEGNGFVISSMSIVSMSNLNYAALFSAVGVGGTIRNVGVRNARVNVGDDSVFTSALVGRNDGRVAACWVAGGGVTGGWSAGGLVGVNHGVVIASYANVAVHAARNNSGGLIGEAVAGSVVSASYSIGKVTGGSQDGGPRRGGLVGQRNETDDAVYDVQASYYDRGRSGQTSCCGQRMPSSDAQTSRTSVQLRAPTAAMGIYAGWDKLNVDDTTGTVMGVRTLNDDAPWDFGSGLDYPMLRGVSARYPTGNTTSAGVQRRLQPPVSLTLSQRGADLVTEGQDVEYIVELDVPSVSQLAMSWSVEYTGAGDGHAEALDFDGDRDGLLFLTNTNSVVFRVGIADDGTSERRETFRVRVSGFLTSSALRQRLNVASSAVVSVIAPNGKDYDPDGNNLINVATTSQLAAIRYDLGGAGLRGVADGDVVAYDEAFPFFDEAETCAGGCKGYELSNDVDLSSVRNWTPLGGGNPIKYYTAVFEGNGHVVSNLRIQSSLRLDNAGLFGAVSGVGTIRNVGLRDVSVEVGGGSMHTGALVGRNEGKVAACYVTGGSVKGVSATGGLAGANHGTVLASYAAVGVHADGLRSGGLIGRAAIGSVVSASYSIGRVTGGAHGASTYRGGLVGGRDEADAAEYDVQASYFDHERSGQSSCCGENEPSPDRSSRTSIELRAPTAAVGIYAGWNQLDVDGVASTAMGVVTLNDDAPWDFGSRFDYPALRGVSIRYPGGNTTSIRVQRQRQPSVPVVMLATPAYIRTTESDVELRFEVALSPATAVIGEDVTIHYQVSGTATAGADYRDEDGGMVVMAVGTTRAVIRLRLLDDYVIEPEEELVLRLLRTRGDSVAVATTRFSTVVTIANDDRLVVDAHVYLQGAYGGSRGMSTGLIDVLPRRQPYNVAPWNYPAATTVPHVGEGSGLSGVTSTIVDWVLVEVRTGATADAALASAPTTGGRAAGLLLRDGRIAGINEEAATAADTLFLNGVHFETELPEGQEVYVLVHHRNHLSVISANASAPGGEGCNAGYCVDFRFAQSHGGRQAEVGQGTYAMVAGDVDRNGVVDERDEVLIRVHNLRSLTSLGAGAYRDPDAAGNYAVDADLDFDGEVLSADRCFVLAPGTQGRCRTFSAP